jgi:UDP-MurNAc hydroxylase
MQIRMTGHAGLFIRAGEATILCDPWFSPAYFGSWFPFPDNADLDLEAIRTPDYLFISHLHKDHFDRAFLRGHVDKGATVLLPDFPLPELRLALEEIGFHTFIETRSGRPVRIEGGARVAIATSVSVADGPIGDSALAVDDGTARILNQNDCHPRDLRALGTLGPYDVHFLQYSGAIWYPMVYRLDPSEMAKLCREKRERQVTRALHYISEIGAPHVVPFAGPPCFLDEDLFELNDFDQDPEKIFMDQRGFLDELEKHPEYRGHLAVPGTDILVEDGHVEVHHAMDPDELRDAYEDKRNYLTRYRQRRTAQLDEAVPSTGTLMEPDAVVAALKEWFEPLLASAPHVRAALGGPILLDVGRYAVVIDPTSGEVRRHHPEVVAADGRPGADADDGNEDETDNDNIEGSEHGFAFAESLLSSLVERHVEDWVNELFLSCRFEAWRTGAYNEAVFSFFKCLSPERMAYYEAARTLAAQHDEAAAQEDLWRCGDYLVQRSCPHLGADLSRFSEVTDGILTCALHGRRFDLETGTCLDADCGPLFTHRVPSTPARPDQGG